MKEPNMRTSYEKAKKNCAQMPDTRKSGIEEAEEMRERAKNAYKSKKSRKHFTPKVSRSMRTSLSKAGPCILNG
ncbi:hypothetical protein [Cytobacillus kochii]|uniref:Uncharacterized protein n=1 Tax=Cytobacillus kochii TaxID=859143 RepID=A0A248TGR4_9BACI|nr:hypothetical protein [Cytobacillus kochii]ASV67396.1 hypothetical protein CKF48_08685 [Cytobacillus kochii]